jgi:hypothetical protein
LELQAKGQIYQVRKDTLLENLHSSLDYDKLFDLYSQHANEVDKARLLQWCRDGYVTPDLNHPINNQHRIERPRKDLTRDEKLITATILESYIEGGIISPASQ